MKKMIIILLLLAGATHGSGQSLDQTVDWLKAKVLTAKGWDAVIRPHVISVAVEYDDTGVTQWDYVNMATVKSVSSLQCDRSSHPVPCIRLNWGPHNTFLRLSASTSSEDVERITKALRHLATLNGATVVDDDLFK